MEELYGNNADFNNNTERERVSAYDNHRIKTENNEYTYNHFDSYSTNADDKNIDYGNNSDTGRFAHQIDNSYENNVSHETDSVYGREFTSQSDIPYTREFIGQSNNANTDNTYHTDNTNDFSYQTNNEDTTQYTRKKRTEKKKNSFGDFTKIAIIAAVMGLACGLSYGCFTMIKDAATPKNNQQITTTVTDTKSHDNDKISDISDIVDNVMPSVVSITGKYQINNIFGMPGGEIEGAGSGFIISEDNDYLYVATNNHLVNDSSSLVVGFVDDTSANAQIVGKDTDADLAVIKVSKKDMDDKTLKAVKKATLGNSDKAKVGQQVIVIGNALGYGQSVTTGILSAKDREVHFTDGTMNLLQTDASINPGNSGGVLINTKGEVIGINNAKLADTAIEGVGYAIPITTANTILTDLMNAGNISENDVGFLGIIGKDINETYSQALGIPKGVYVAQVVKDSPAEKSDINAGDVITKIDGNSVATMKGLKEKISIKKADTDIVITIKRANQSGEYEEKEINVKLAKASDFKENETNNQINNNQLNNQQEQQQNQNNQNIQGNDPNNQQIPDEYAWPFGQDNSGNSQNFEDFFFDF